MKTVKINLYQFSELSEEAQQKAISEHENFLFSVGYEVENEVGELVTIYPDEMEENEVIESIESNEYYFFASGELANVIQYCGEHPNSGKIEFNYHGEKTFI